MGPTNHYFRQTNFFSFSKGLFIKITQPTNRGRSQPTQLGSQIEKKSFEEVKIKKNNKI
jgi:hypothetical protein